MTTRKRILSTAALLVLGLLFILSGGRGQSTLRTSQPLLRLRPLLLRAPPSKIS
jgi:hypothetical protein